MLDSGVCPLAEFNVVVMDEAHTLQDCTRGAMYEMLLAKLRFKQLTAEQCVAAGQQGQASGSPGSSRQALAARQKMQIVCMSATLPGPRSFARWLGEDARLYMTAWRAVPLQLFLVSDLRHGFSWCMLLHAS